MLLSILMISPLVAMLIWAAVIDIRCRRIPNWLSLAVFAGGIIYQCILPGGSIGHGAMGLGAGFFAALLLHLIGALGAGDVKLMGALGVWIGPLPTLAVFGIAAVVGMFLALGTALASGRLSQLLQNTLLLVADLYNSKRLSKPGPVRQTAGRPLPFAVAILIAAGLTIAWKSLR